MKNVCIVGYGMIGPNHANAFEGVENARLYAVCDINEEKIKKCRESFDVVAYTDFDEMLLDENIHSVHICTPHYLHAEMVKKALRAGKSVVCEKPVAMTRKEFDDLKSFKGAENVCLVFQNRLNNCVKKLKEITQSGEMGELKAVKSILTWHRSPEYYRHDEWRGKWATEGGGVLINQAVHSLDLLSYIVGNMNSLKANMANYSLQDVIEVEDTFMAYLGFENGINGFFLATNSFPVDSSMDMDFVFENGDVRYINGKLMVNDTIVATDEVAQSGKAYWGAGHKGIIKNFYDKGEFFSIRDAENTMNALFAMYESAKNNGMEIKF